MSGVGTYMEKVMEECGKIMDDIMEEKKLDFIFPDEDHIARKLSSEEHARRKLVKKTGERAISDLLEIDDEFLDNLPDEVKEKLKEKLGM